MKKIILLSSAFFCVLFSFAQRRYGTRSQSYGTQAELGLKAGVNLANVSDNEASSIDSRTGLYIGGLAHIHMSPELALQPEVVYSAQGAQYRGGTSKLDYINIPVMLQYMFGTGFRLETGPQLGILTSAKFKNNNGTEDNIKSSIKSTDFSWGFGASFLTRSGLGIGARYNLGINNIYLNSPYEIKNRVWQLGLFYQARH